MGCGSSRIDDGYPRTRPPGAGNRNNQAAFTKDSTYLLNARIEEQLQQARRKERNTAKILLLGSGESGKSTVLKQMRLIHGQGFTDFERLQYGKVIWYDCVKSMKILIAKSKILRVQLSNEKAFKAARSTVMSAGDGLEEDADLAEFSTELPEEIQRDADRAARAVAKYKAMTYYDDPMSMDDPSTKDIVYREEYDDSGSDTKEDYEVGAGDDDDINDIPNSPSDSSMSIGPPTSMSRKQISSAIALLWHKDPGIRQVYARSNEFQLEVNAEYYFEHIAEYAQPNYHATDLDILIGRIKTTGITETVFDIQGSRICMVDVGGQRSERKKWIHCFNNVTAVLFVCAVSEFDEVLFEDDQVNRMTEAMLLYEQIINSPWFYKTPIILFLNKNDILEQKLKKRTFKHYFPEYTGNPTSTDEVVKFMREKFLAMNRVPGRPVYVHRTCATDTNSMKFVIAAVTDVIFQKNLLMSGVV